MFFYAAKIVGFLLQPSAILLLSVIGAFVALSGGWSRLARWPAAIAAAIVMAGISPLPNILTLPLEQRFTRATLDGPPVTGIIVLGGGEDAYVGQARQAHALTDAGERISEAVELARRLPNARVIFSGGSADLAGGGPTEAVAVVGMWTGMGIARERILAEDRSRDTFENAVFTRELVRPQPGQRWLLITSATHMPRAMGIFRKAGFAVEPWPVDYRTSGWADAYRWFYVPADGLRRLDLVTREYVGLLAYRITGRSDEVWPGP